MDGRGPLVDRTPASAPLPGARHRRRRGSRLVLRPRERPLVRTAGRMTYVELHAHSAYSFLDGASTPEELLAAAAVHGYPAMALTDHDGLWGAMEFAQAAKGLGIKAITGAELSLTDGSHLTLLVQDRTGYRNLCRL